MRRHPSAARDFRIGESAAGGSVKRCRMESLFGRMRKPLYNSICSFHLTHKLPSLQLQSSFELERAFESLRGQSARARGREKNLIFSVSIRACISIYRERGI